MRPKRNNKKREPDQPARNGPDVPVVGIGASAGGLGALETLLPLLTPDAGIAYVVVQHLDPDHESVLASLLARVARIPVVEIKDQTTIEPDCVYIIPPNVSLTVGDGHLQLSPPVEQRGQRTPIDGFFTSLAEAKGEGAAGVILSGTGSDGTIGLRAIKEHGGLTAAQDDAEYDGMMRSAVRSGMVDFVLPLEKIPAKLYDYFQHLTEIDGRKGPDGVRQEATNHLAQICALLRTRTGHDFSGYKDRTVARRVQRRMQVLQIDEVPDFIDRLRREPQELDALLQDLLIGVTSFFRDPAAFEALEREVIPQLFEGKGPYDTVRIWVPGCSTGEEAYSIAILLGEHMPNIRRPPKLQIFASDIDEQSLQIARAGRFPSTIARDVPPARLERYFVREDGTYRIASDLRETCLFSVHNLLRDAPFSKLDLIACRNPLIYLTPELQNQLIPLFHYALNDAGFLFLGTSENVSRHSRLFATVDKAHRIFRHRPQLERRLPEFPLSAPEGDRRKLASGPRVVVEHEPLQTLAERQLLDRYSPAYVVINADGELLHGSARTGKYLELAAGVPRMDIYSMARPGLRPDLRAAVHKAAGTGQVAVQKNVVVGTDGGRQPIDLIVHPIRPAGPVPEPLYMVIFQDIGGIKPTSETETSAGAEELENASLRQLEMELRATRERLQATTEELESSNEELRSGNEELSSMNEELQSANEELETSKEELQSMNEELQTVNAELNARVEELSRANSDIANLLESTQIATVFLDGNLAVKSFTPAAKDVFRLVESDTGRPISHVRSRFHSDTVQEDAERVMRTLSTIERQVENTHNDARYVMRMMPYRTVDNMIAGVVITFVDVTRLTAAEQRINELTRDLRLRIQSLETLLNLVPVGILIIEDNRSDQIRVNRYGADLLGQIGGSEAEGPRLVAENVRVLEGDRELRREEHPLQRAAHFGQAVPGFDGHLLRPDGTRIDVTISATPLFDDAGKVRGGIAVILDTSERRQGEAHQQVLLYELQHRVKNLITTIIALAGRTVQGSATLDDFSTTFLGRLQAMAATHELLSHGNWTGANLRELIEAAAQSHLGRDTQSVRLRGPELTLSANAASTLGLVFYELVTNASKYGGLSAPGGHVDVVWRAEDSEAGRLVLDWIERDGPRLAGPLGDGFGTSFIKRSIEYELGGRVELQPLSDGLRCTLAFPLKRGLQGKA